MQCQFWWFQAHRHTLLPKLMVKYGSACLGVTNKFQARVCRPPQQPPTSQTMCRIFKHHIAMKCCHLRYCMRLLFRPGVEAVSLVNSGIALIDEWNNSSLFVVYHNVQAIVCFHGCCSCMISALATEDMHSFPELLLK